MNVLITGAGGFVGKNLSLRLAEKGVANVASFTRKHSPEDLPRMLENVNLVFHLAGVNRPQDPHEFQAGNVELTRRLTQAIARTGRPIPVVFTSSTQAALENDYGRSKRAAEEVLRNLQQEQGSQVFILRLPGIFGKWCRPHYNSVVATFCHYVATGQPCPVRDPAAPLTLVHIDDVVNRLLSLMKDSRESVTYPGFVETSPQYQTTVGELAAILTRFRESRRNLFTERTGEGFLQKLYGTYLSYLSPAQFVYDVPTYPDDRGTFVEMLKTRDSGQFSCFNLKPGTTRGSHYHHRKSEKFLPLCGKVRMRFRHLGTGETHEVQVQGGTGRIIESVPGWAHDITNTGKDEAWVMLWANEAFDRSDPDCISCEV